MATLPRAWRASAITAALRRRDGEGVARMCGTKCRIHLEYASQQYTLTVTTDGISICGGSTGAIAYALKTLYQYVIAVVSARSPHSVPRWTKRYTVDRMGALGGTSNGTPNGASNGTLSERRSRLSVCDIPNIHIEDRPAILTRGFMLDISRDRVPRLRELRALVRVLGLLKYNHMQLYTEHTFAYRGHRPVWRRASPLRKRHIRQLDTIAHQEGIELMPNQNCLGHMERWLTHKKYRHLSECPSGFVDPWNVFRPDPSTRSVTNPHSDNLIEDIIGQYAPLFRSSRMHIGYDEPWEFAQGESKREAQRIGVDTLFYRSIHTVHDMCRRVGKKSYVWGDSVIKYAQKLSTLSDEIGLCLWGYEASDRFEQEIEAVRTHHPKKSDILLFCGTSNWNSVAGRLLNAEKNMIAAVDACAAYALEGVVLAEWGDNGHFQQHPFLFLPIVLFSQYGWHNTGHHEREEGRAALNEGQAALNERRAPALKWMDRYLFQDPQQRIADIVCALSTITERYAFDLNNASILHCMLLGDTHPYYRSVYRTYKNHQHRAFSSEIHTLRDAIAALPRSLVRRELLWTVDTLSFAGECIAAISQLNQPALAGIAKEERGGLRRQCAVCINRYRALWRKRSRRGGRGGSVDRLIRTLRELSAS